jgi:NAD(P)-dependent dehydrogenase (short-subunit alcohol dehydrogenase family)
MRDDEWYDLMSSNLFGYYNGCRSALRVMVPQRSGNIVNVSSVTATQPINEAVAYVTAKGGVVGMTKALAIEFGPLGIVINAIAPGATETPLTESFYTPEVRASYEARIGVARVAKPRDIADALLFLCTSNARYVCGHELMADGGLAINGNVGMAAQ